MLTLTQKNALLTNVNIRAECHGDEKVPAVDLSFAIDGPAAMLGGLSPLLPSALFQRDDAPADLATDPDALSKYKFAARIEALSWRFPKPVAARVVLHFGVSGASDIVFASATIDKVRIEPHDGGTVSMNFRVQTNEATAEQRGRIEDRLQSALDITVEPLPEAQGDLLDGDEDVRQTPKQAAESLFTDGSAAEREKERKPKRVKAPAQWPFPTKGEAQAGEAPPADDAPPAAESEMEVG